MDGRDARRAGTCWQHATWCRLRDGYFSGAGAGIAGCRFSYALAGGTVLMGTGVLFGTSARLVACCVLAVAGIFLGRGKGQWEKDVMR